MANSQSAQSFALPFLAGIATAGVVGYLYNERRVERAPPDTKSSTQPLPSVKSTGSSAQSTEPAKYLAVTQDAPKVRTSPVESQSPTEVAAPKTKPFSEVREVYDPRRGWVSAPPDTGVARSKTPQERAFVVHYRESPSGRAAEDSIWLIIEAEGLLEKLREFFPNAIALYDTKPGIDGREVYLKRRPLRASVEHSADDNVLVALLDVVDAQFEIMQVNQSQANRSILPENAITWPYLWCLFPNGCDIETIDDATDESQALVLDSWSYTIDARGRTFAAKCHFYQWTGTAFYRMERLLKIPEFHNIQDIASLKFRPLEADRKPVLTDRGKRYLQYAGLVHADYSGIVFTKLWSGVNRLEVDGRVMIDVRGFRKSNPTQDIWPDDNNRLDDPPKLQRSTAPVPITIMSEDDLYLLPPSLHGFSLNLKRWGEMLVDRLSAVQWNPSAFGTLVIPDDYRSIIKALVDVHSGKLKGGLIEDVVKGKGDGLIISLHGIPGTGKTLTAEAVSEHLRRPLYTISAGELGTTIVNLERKLQDTLELATSWKAVLLIDEADIFLEKRSNTNIERNAMVGIFLRLLEYFSGVLILTTNRLSEFDEAFESRFSVTLSFNGLSQESRAQLWSQFLQQATAAKEQSALAEFDIQRLSQIDLNGRMIRQAVRTAQALAMASDAPFTMSQLTTVLGLLRPTEVKQNGKKVGNTIQINGAV